MQLFPAEPSGGVLIWQGVAYTLTQVEYRILDNIARNAPVSGCDIGGYVFPSSPLEARQRMVSSYVARLRKKVGEIVEAKRDGYRFIPEVQSSESGMQG
jgi:DNA-binding response OmpR family regulator